jgi:hypothetical protein
MRVDRYELTGRILPLLRRFEAAQVSAARAERRYLFLERGLCAGAFPVALVGTAAGYWLLAVYSANSLFGVADEYVER